ncbi:MAG: hypothetical protein CME06_17075 [Gemmatimonadetes bacterium]|nr:hypothetical protein [Gemmatimonadota bacterium]
MEFSGRQIRGPPPLPAIESTPLSVRIITRNSRNTEMKWIVTPSSTLPDDTCINQDCAPQECDCFVKLPDPDEKADGGGLTVTFQAKK